MSGAVDTTALPEAPRKVAAPLRVGAVEYFGACGFASLDEAYAAPETYALRLIRYLACDSTVRARCLDRHGAAAPTRARIAELRADHLAKEAWLAGRFGVAEPIERDAIEFAVRAPGWRPPAVRKAGSPPPRVAPADFVYVPPVEGVVPDGRASWLELVRQVAQAHALTAADLIGPSRRLRVSAVRQLAYALLAARGNSASLIGRWIGGRDHASVEYGVRRFHSHGMADPELAATWARLRPGHAGLGLEAVAVAVAEAPAAEDEVIA